MKIKPIAPTEGKILLLKNLFFVDQKERPTEVPFRVNKKRFLSKRLE